MSHGIVDRGPRPPYLRPAFIGHDLAKRATSNTESCEPGRTLHKLQ
jgi:hypothetical protein